VAIFSRRVGVGRGVTLTERRNGEQEHGEEQLHGTAVMMVLILLTIIVIWVWTFAILLDRT
jgi:hypothetical protein